MHERITLHGTPLNVNCISSATKLLTNTLFEFFAGWGFAVDKKVWISLVNLFNYIFYLSNLHKRNGYWVLRFKLKHRSCIYFKMNDISMDFMCNKLNVNCSAWSP